MFLAAFLLVLTLAAFDVGRRGDMRDLLGFALIACQFGLENVFTHNQLVGAVIFTITAWCLVYFSVKEVGVYVGVLSGLLAILAVLSHFGFIPNETGQGMTWNYHHLSTVMMYGQIFLLWGSTYGNHPWRTHY